MPQAPAPRDVQAIAVISAGKLGRGIAQATAVAGYRTILEDLLPNALRRAQSEIRAHLDEIAGRGQLSPTDADAAFRRIQYAGSIEDAARVADLIIESVPDELESKIEIFTLLDKICRPQTILVANTTSLSVSEIASVTYRTKLCVGMRFQHPVHEMKQLQIVRARDTSEETLATALQVGRRLGKQVAVMNEAPVPNLVRET